MTRDGMPRAYLRVDPNIDQHPDPTGMIMLLCAAARQPERGHFKDRSIIVRAIGNARTKALTARGDVAQLPDGRWYVQGWDEWQEGDFTVTERMRRMRARRRNSGVTPHTLVTERGVTTDAVDVPIEERSSSNGVGDDNPPNPRQAGGLRSNGTSPRQLAKAEAALKADAAKERREAGQRIRLDYASGRMTEGQKDAALLELAK